MKISKDKIKSALWGHIIGDALGVPVEFTSRQDLMAHPITDMIGYGTYNQPPGTWSDDSSLMLATVDSLLTGYDLYDIGRNFLLWIENANFTPWDEVFDIGNTTYRALSNLKATGDPKNSGEKGSYSNGNGSLMRILPIAFIFDQYDKFEKYRIVSEVSAITHAHIISKVSCYIFVKFLEKLNELNDKFKAYYALQGEIQYFIRENLNNEIYLIFERVLESDISELEEKDIFSKGYVVYTLEASIWAFLKTNTFKEAVLTAINLGEDTDTTGAVTGGLAGFYYGLEAIPQKWINQVANKNYVEEFIDAFADEYGI